VARVVDPRPALTLKERRASHSRDQTSPVGLACFARTACRLRASSRSLRSAATHSPPPQAGLQQLAAAARAADCRGEGSPPGGRRQSARWLVALPRQSPALELLLKLRLETFRWRHRACRRLACWGLAEGIDRFSPEEPGLLNCLPSVKAGTRWRGWRFFSPVFAALGPERRHASAGPRRSERGSTPFCLRTNRIDDRGDCPASTTLAVRSLVVRVRAATGRLTRSAGVHRIGTFGVRGSGRAAKISLPPSVEQPTSLERAQSYGGRLNQLTNALVANGFDPNWANWAIWALDRAAIAAERA